MTLDLEPIKRRRAAVGPAWGGGVVRVGDYWCACGPASRGDAAGVARVVAELEFLLHASGDVAALVGEVERLRAREGRGRRGAGALVHAAAAADDYDAVAGALVEALDTLDRLHGLLRAGRATAALAVAEAHRRAVGGAR